MLSVFKDFIGFDVFNSFFNGFMQADLKETIKTFNELYKSEGYSVELTLEDSSIGAVNEIKRVNKNTTDLYLDYNSVNILVESSYIVSG